MSVKLKRLVAQTLAPIGAFRVCGALKSLAGGKLLLLGYHRVLPAPNEQEHAGDVELVSATPEQFEWQMRYLAERFEPVNFAQIAAAFEGGTALPKRAVTVTFDDGFYDLHAYALPVLRQTGMSATVFVATDFVDNGGTFWFDHVAWVLRNVGPRALPLPDSIRPLAQDSSEAGLRRTIAAMLKWLKNCAEAERGAYVARIRTEFPAPPSAGLGRALTWSEVREMSVAGVEFGSHTVSHRCLARLSGDELEHELGYSKKRIEDETGKAVAALAYPFGGHAAFNEEVIAVARRVGYRIAATYIPGVNTLRTADRFTLLRQHVERDTSRAYFEAIANLPEVFR